MSRAIAVPDEGPEAVHLPILQRPVKRRVVPARGCVQRGTRLCGDLVGGFDVWMGNVVGRRQALLKSSGWSMGVGQGPG